jgi:hypothetical protein
MNENKKYPKSLNGLQCISPCFPANYLTTHPITLQKVMGMDKINPYCHILPHMNEEKKHIAVAVCSKPSTNEEIKKHQVNLLIPIANIDSSIFLRGFYDIITFEDGMNWIINNENKPVMTRLRVFDNMLIAYGKDIDIIDIRMVDFMVDVIKKLWIKDIYKELHKYIFINEKKEIFIKENDSDINKNINEKINFIIKKFINSDEVYKFMSRYIKARYEDWDKILSHINNIKNDYIEYIEKKIKLTISNNSTNSK